MPVHSTRAKARKENLIVLLIIECVIIVSYDLIYIPAITVMITVFLRDCNRSSPSGFFPNPIVPAETWGLVLNGSCVNPEKGNDRQIRSRFMGKT